MTNQLLLLRFCQADKCLVTHLKLFLDIYLLINLISDSLYLSFNRNWVCHCSHFYVIQILKHLLVWSRYAHWSHYLSVLTANLLKLSFDGLTLSWIDLLIWYLSHDVLIKLIVDFMIIGLIALVHQLMAHSSNWGRALTTLH